MKLENRIEKLEQISSPVENAADGIRRADRERRTGIHTPSAPYIPGQSELADALYEYKLKRDGGTGDIS